MDSNCYVVCRCHWTAFWEGSADGAPSLGSLVAKETNSQNFSIGKKNFDWKKFSLEKYFSLESMPFSHRN